MSQRSTYEPKTPNVGLDANSYVFKNAQVSLKESDADFCANFWANKPSGLFADRFTLMPALSANETEVLLNDSDFDENYDDITVVMPTAVTSQGTKYPYVLNMEGMDKKILSPPKLTRKKARIVDSDEEDEVVKLEEVQHHELGYEVQAAAMALSDGELMDPVTAPKNVKKRKSAPAAQANDDDEDVKPKGNAVQRYCFTYNNPAISGDDFDLFLKTKADNRGHVFQLEEGEAETPHFQGYLELEKRMYTTGVHKMLAPHKMHLEHAKGSKLSNKKYCTKEEGRKEGPWIYGSLESDKTGDQGKRTDTDRLAERCIEAGGITLEIIEEMPGTAMRFQKHARELVQAKELLELEAAEIEYYAGEAAKEDAGLAITGQRQRNLELYFGPTAAGKTTKVKVQVMGRLKERMFEKDCSNKWWDGYNQQKHVLMDEFRGSSFGTPEDFNRITNHGTVKVERKQGTANLVAENLYFTTNRHPSHWWKEGAEYMGWKDARYRAIARRFATVYWWNDNKDLVVLQNPGPEKDTDEWKTANAEWKRFWEWKGRPLQAGDSYIPTNDDDYFTLP